MWHTARVDVLNDNIQGAVVQPVQQRHGPGILPDFNKQAHA